MLHAYKMISHLTDKKVNYYNCMVLLGYGFWSNGWVKFKILFILDFEGLGLKTSYQCRNRLKTYINPIGLHDFNVRFIVECDK